MERRLVLFLEPKNAETNNMIAEALKSLGLMTEDEFSTKRDEKNVPRPKWECPYNIVSSLVQKRRKDKSVKFVIWKKNGDSYEDGEFLFKKKKKVTPKPSRRMTRDKKQIA